MPWFRRPPDPPAEPDAPVGFGYKMAWYAARTDDPAAVAEVLGLSRLRPCNWRAGVARIYDYDTRSTVFVTPPVGGWVLAAGWPLAPKGSWLDCPRVAGPLEALSARFGDAQYFFTYRVIDMHVWARAEVGRLTRAFGYWGDHGDMRWEVGWPTPEEEALGLDFPPAESRLEAHRRDEADPGADGPLTPDEEHVIQIAGAWSLDPTRLDERFKEPGTGLLGELAR